MNKAKRFLLCALAAALACLFVSCGDDTKQKPIIPTNEITVYDGYVDQADEYLREI